MKRFISILLAIMLVTALIPTSFAAEKNLTIKKNVFEYSFTTAAYGLTNSPSAAASQLELCNKETKPEVSDQWNLVLRYGVNWMQIANASGEYINFTVREANKDKDDCVIAIKLNIPTAGTFIPELTYKGVPSGYIHDIYLAKSDGTIKPSKLDSEEENNAVLALVENGDFLGTVDMFEAEDVIKTVSLDPVTIAAGEEGDYLLVLCSNGYNEKFEPYVPDGRTDKFLRGYIRNFKLTADFNAAAVENGTLNYDLGMAAMNGAQMLTANSVDINKDGTADLEWSKSPILRGSKGIGTLNYAPVMNWWSTTPYGKDFVKNGFVEADPPIQVMNLAKTDPWSVEYFDAYNSRITVHPGNNANDDSDDYMYYNIRIGKMVDGAPSIFDSAQDYFVLYKVIIPYAGEYDFKFIPSSAAIESGPVPAVYFFPVKGTKITSKSTALSRIKSASADEKIGYVNFSSNDIEGTLDKTPVRVSAPHAGEYYIAIKPDNKLFTLNDKYTISTSKEVDYIFQNAYFRGITLTPVAKTEDYITDIDITISDVALIAGESSAATVTADYFKGGTSALTEGVTYKSSAESVASVDANGNITALRQGTAFISAMTEDGMVSAKKVTVADKKEDKNVLYCVTNNVEEAQDIKSADRGTSITVTAKDITGYTFRHWVRGTEDKGTWLSSDKSYTFTLMTKTYLTAVYSEDATGKVVEFFNENGEFLSDAVVAEDGTVALPAENPKRTGFKFLKWLISETEELTAETVLESLVTRAVARYESTGDTFAVEKDGKETASYSYDDKITASSSYVYTDPKTGEQSTLTPDVFWYRDGKQVDYGKEYKYYVWDKTTITKSYTGTNAPLVVLDDVVKADNAYMIEYDGAGKQIIEVGILFGRAGTTPTIEACDGKATSQRTEEHGQFTAKVDDATAVARGYLIYNDAGTYRVIYSD